MSIASPTVDLTCSRALQALAHAIEMGMLLPPDFKASVIQSALSQHPACTTAFAAMHSPPGGCSFQASILCGVMEERVPKALKTTNKRADCAPLAAAISSILQDDSAMELLSPKKALESRESSQACADVLVLLKLGARIAYWAENMELAYNCVCSLHAVTKLLSCVLKSSKSKSASAKEVS